MNEKTNEENPQQQMPKEVLTLIKAKNELLRELDITKQNFLGRITLDDAQHPEVKNYLDNVTTSFRIMHNLLEMQAKVVVLPGNFDLKFSKNDKIKENEAVIMLNPINYKKGEKDDE